ncbi:MAG: hypothetical protein ACRC2T_09960 [Thermoguttaceae bacterium]
MSNEEFTIHCQTCEAKLRVRNPALIGHVLACPKCGSMVLVEKPEPANVPKPSGKVLADQTTAKSISKILVKASNEPAGESVVQKPVASEPVADASENETSGAKTQKEPQNTTEKQEESSRSTKNIKSTNSSQSANDINDTKIIESTETAENAPIIRTRIPQTSVKTTRLILTISLVSVIILLSFVYFVILNQRKTQENPSNENLPQKNQVGQISPGEDNLPVNAHNNIAANVTEEPEVNVGIVAPNANQESVTADGLADGSNEKLPDLETEIKAVSKENVAGDETAGDETAGDETGNNADNAFADADDLGSDLESDISDEPNQEPFVPQAIKPREIIDVPKRLEIPIASLSISETPLFSVVETLSELSGVPITWDVANIRANGISLETPILMKLEKTTVGEALTTILIPNGLSFLIEEEQISVFASQKADPKFEEKVYDVSDIFAISQSAVNPGANDNAILTIKELSEKIPLLISPQTWQSANGQIIPENIKPNGEETDFGTELKNDLGNGLGSSLGTVTVSEENKTLTITQTEANHYEIRRLLEQIRTCRTLPLRTEFSEKELLPEKFATDVLNKNITLHFYSPTPISELLIPLENFTGLKIIADHKSLNSAGTPLRELKATVHVEGNKISDMFAQLLASVNEANLDYRIVGSDMIEITTEEAANAEESFTLQSHSFERKLKSLPEIKKPEELAELLKKTIQPDSWDESENRSTGRKNATADATILVDPVSNTFFIRQSQPAQRKIHEWLNGDTR